MWEEGFNEGMKFILCQAIRRVHVLFLEDEEGGQGEAEEEAFLSWMEARFGSTAIHSLAVLFDSLHAAAFYSNPA